MIICQICNRESNNIQGLSNHLRLSHKLNTTELKQQYYDTYMKQENEGICQKCGNLTHFQDLTRGYTKFCCKSCQVSFQNNAANPIVREKMRATMYERYGYEEIFSSPDVIKKSHSKSANDKRYITYKLHHNNDKKTLNKTKHISTNKKTKIKRKQTEDTTKIKRKNNLAKNRETALKNVKIFEKENNCTWKKTLVELYGQGWLSLQLPTLINKRRVFISNEYLPNIQEYASTNHRQRSSKKEQELYNELKSICKFDIKANVRSIIPHRELDIFIPKLNLAFEYNGVKWHSIENGMSKDYHLNKSLLCRDYNIRLVHIYESENFKEQLDLAKSLIMGIDKYNKNDFNKNNFLDIIPDPEIIYKSKNYTVYGAGKLY